MIHVANPKFQNKWFVDTNVKILMRMLIICFLFKYKEHVQAKIDACNQLERIVIQHKKKHDWYKQKEEKKWIKYIAHAF